MSCPAAPRSASRILRFLVGLGLFHLLGLPSAAQAEAVWEPAAGIVFPTGDLGSASDSITYLYNTGSVSLHVTSVASTSPEFEVVSFLPGSIVLPGEFALVLVRYRRSTAGTHSGSVSMTLSLPGAPALSLPMSGSTSPGSPLATLDVSSLDFGILSVGSSGERTFRLTNGGNAPLTIHELAATRPELTVLATFPQALLPGAGRNFTVRFDALVAGAFSDQLTILSDAANAPTLELPAVAQVARPAVAALDPEGFDPVAIGFADSLRQEVTLRNDGDEWPLTGTVAVEIDSVVVAPGVPLLPSVPLPQLRFDGDGVPWLIRSDGAVTQGDAGVFEFGGDWLAFPEVTSAELLDGGRAVRLGPSVIQDRWELTREIHVALPGAGVRYLETVRNVSAFAANFRMQLSSAIRIAETWQVSTSDGDAVLEVADDWIVIANGGGPAIAHVFAGPGGDSRAAYVDFSPVLERVNVDFTLALGPGESASILHTLQQSSSEAEAIERAGALRTPTMTSTTGLDPFERVGVLNTRVPLAIWSPLDAFSIAPLDSIPLALDFDGRGADGLERVYGTLRISTNDPARPTIALPVELRLTETNPGTIDVGAPTDGRSLAARFMPNPASGGALRLAYTLPAAGAVEFALFDVRGRRVASRTLAAATAGAGSFDWAGGPGAPVVALAPGVYWTRLTQGGRSVMTRGVVLR